MKILRPAVMCFLMMTIICGVIYTAAVTGIAQLLFPGQANGSTITVTLKDGTQKDYGSTLIAQEFTGAGYMVGRPMGVTNLSSVSEEQKALVQERTDWLHTLDPDNTADIPMDLVTASGSGVDPNITPEAAEYQVSRLARERGISEDDVRAIISKYTTGRFLGIFGEPSVNVLKVNLALDDLL
ncbi:K(+)-transporting ATPase subunit C [Clostridium sp. KNHs205]|uniref:K(+)-transporting ATPase subunit C n=1 Tax=Clostridium sp. KNHs205 TaxID=1449050 RepID=UPI0018CC0AB2|nr:K(+)-transporting ATPase subunit C [Clostridium sp. KNHs205]